MPMAGKLAVLGTWDKRVLGIQDDELIVTAGPRDPLDDQAHSEPDTLQRRAAQPLGDQLPRAVDESGLDGATPFTRVDSDVLNHAGRLAPTPHFDLGDGNGSFDSGDPRSEVGRSSLVGGPGQIVEDPREMCHDYEVWQYRRAETRV